ATSQATDPADFVMGPQAPIGNSWFDQTQIARAKVHGAACVAMSPTDPVTVDQFVMLNYYDLPLTLYIAYKGSGDTSLQTLARGCADNWWRMPWISEGKNRPW